MDFSLINPVQSADDGAEMEIRHPNTGEVLLDSEGKSSVIRLRGPHSKKYRAFMQEYERKRMKGVAVDEAKFVVDFAMLATISWDNISWEGKPLECTPENMRKLYTEREFITAQISGFVKPENFTTSLSAA
jgi:hypothetical protein